MKRLSYFLIFCSLMAVEICIALFVHDSLIRPYVGDMLVTLLLKDDHWQYGKIIVGDVTPAFVQMLLNQPKPTDTELENKMTPFFNIFLDDNFQSCHYGTELYIRSMR